MPILIKSSGGQRTCKIMSSNSRDDLIEALKGLTFKFEVRITDIERRSGPEDEPAAEQTQPVPSLSVTNPSIVSNNVASRPNDIAAPQPVQPVPQVSIAPRPTITPAKPVESDDFWSQSNAPQTKPSYPNREINLRSADDRTSSEIKSEPRYGSAVSAPTMVPSILTRKHGILEKPKRPRIVRGKLDATQKTCCITVEVPEYPAVAYIAYNNQKLLEVTKAITDVALDIQAQSEVRSVDVGDIVFAKSKEDNSWYRSMIEAIIDDNTVEVNYFDWGLTEKLELDRIRRMTQPNLGLSIYPACAVKVKFTNKSGEMLDAALQCETEFDIQVNSYDAEEEAYTVTITSLY